MNNNSILDTFNDKNHPLHDFVKLTLDFGFTIEKIQDFFDVYTDTCPSFPDSNNHIFFHYSYGSNLTIMVAEQFFDCPISDESEFMHTVYEVGTYYDPNSKKLTDHLKSLTFTEFLIEMGFESDKALYYNKLTNNDDTAKPEDYIFRIFHLIETYYQPNAYRSKKEQIGDYVKWGRKNFQWADHNFTEEYLMDDDTIMNILNSDKTKEEMSKILKDMYGVETYLTQILDDGHYGGFTKHIVDQVQGSQIDRAKKYMEIKNLRKIKVEYSDNSHFTLCPNTDAT
jgi:hypothetical protein